MIISVWISTEQIIIIIFFPFHKNCNFLPARLFTCNWMHWCALSPFSLVLTSFSYGQYNAEFSTKLRREKKKIQFAGNFYYSKFFKRLFSVAFPWVWYGFSFAAFLHLFSIEIRLKLCKFTAAKRCVPNEATYTQLLI